MKKIFAIALLLASSLHAQVIRPNAGFRASIVPRNDDGSTALQPLGFTQFFFRIFLTYPVQIPFQFFSSSQDSTGENGSDRS